MIYTSSQCALSQGPGGTPNLDNFLIGASVRKRHKMCGFGKSVCPKIAYYIYVFRMQSFISHPIVLYEIKSREQETNTERKATKQKHWEE